MPDQICDVYALFGNPTGHSLSPAMHNAAYREMGVRSIYVPFCVKDLADAVKGLKALGIKGAGITIPFKTAIIELLDEVEPFASRIGAVNTVADRRGRLVGINTDWIGISLTLKAYFAVSGKTFAVLGAGGTARAAVAAVQKGGGRAIVSARNEQKGAELSSRFGCRFVPLDKIDEIRADCLINTTPVGMYPSVDESPLDAALLARFRWVMDVIYNPLETKLMREARLAGCKVISGLDMFVHQGAEQIKFWMDREPPRKLMRDTVVQILKKEAGS